MTGCGLHPVNLRHTYLLLLLKHLHNLRSRATGRSSMKYPVLVALLPQKPLFSLMLLPSPMDVTLSYIPCKLETLLPEYTLKYSTRTTLSQFRSLTLNQMHLKSMSSPLQTLLSFLMIRKYYLHNQLPHF